MTDFTFNTTASIHHESGGAGRMGELVSQLPSIDKQTTILFVTDPGIIRLGLADDAMQSLSRAGFELLVFDQVEADPKEQTILDAVELARNNKVGAVVGFGGGSSMDVAKLIAFLTRSDQSIHEIYGVNQARGKRLPLILVPTTAGTGSEVTAVSIVTTGVEEKKGVVSPVILPDMALLDAQLTIGLPPHITAATGIDAMVHAIEAFTSRSANNNPISKNLAKQALTLLAKNIREAVFNGSNVAARSNMLLGSMLAGQAFANSPVAAVHALAYPIGSLFHVPHGLSNALVLCQVMRFNASHCADQYAALAPYIFAQIDLSQPSEKVSADLISELAELIKSLGLTTSLREVGVANEDVERLATDALKQTRLLVNNPRDVTHADAVTIYEQAL
ncbi:MAG: iron-containing alcohol dehydrogenase [Arenicella sp.]